MATRASKRPRCTTNLDIVSHWASAGKERREEGGEEEEEWWERWGEVGGKERKGRGGKVEASHCESQREDPSSVRGELIILKDIEKPETDILQIPLATHFPDSVKGCDLPQSGSCRCW